MNYVLVLDVAKGKSMFMLSSDIGEVLLEPTEYIHNKSYFEKIDSYINKLNIKDNLTVIIFCYDYYLSSQHLLVFLHHLIFSYLKYWIYNIL